MFYESLLVFKRIKVLCSVVVRLPQRLKLRYTLSTAELPSSASTEVNTRRRGVGSDLKKEDCFAVPS